MHKYFRLQWITPFVVTLIVTAGGMFTAGTAAAQEGGERPFSSPAGPLRDALSAVANTYEINVMASDELVAGKRAPAVRGSMRAEEALRRVLAGSDLEVRRSASGAFVLARKAVQPNTGAGRRARDSVDSNIPRVLDVVTVTGEKVDRSLKDTVSSVAVLTEATMAQSVILELDEALQRVPNVTIVPDGAGLSFRGIPQQGIGNGTFDPVSPTSAIYIDGAVQTQEAVANGVLSTWDLSQIEVFRGPQTATQGRSGLAGALIMTTANPGPEWQLRARVLATDLDREQLSLAVGGPLVDGRLGLRIAAETIDNDGYTEFDFDGETSSDPGRNHRDFVRAKLFFTPTASFDALLGLTYVEGERGTNGVSGPNFFDGISNQVVNLRDSEVLTGSLVMNYTLTDAVTLSSVTGFSNLEAVESVDPATAGGTSFAIPSEADDTTFSQELRLTYDAGSNWRGIFGAYYADIEQQFERTITGSVGPFTVFRNDGFTKAFENYAVFGQLELDLGERVSLTVGGRFESEERDFINFNITDVEPDFPGLPDADDRFEGSGDDTALLPKLGLSYDVNDDVSISATFQQAYRPGGTSFDPSDNSEVQFEPEFSDNFDLAFRAALLDDRLLLNVNAFFVAYSDMQIRVSPDPALPLIRFVDNAGEAELYGVELESLWTVDERWSLYASAAVQESEFKDFQVGGVDTTGDEFAYSPAFSAAIGGTWTHPSGWTATLDFAHEGSYFSNIPNSSDNEVDAYTIVDGRFGYDGGTWGVYLFAENILDEEYVTAADRADADPTLWTAILGQPQTFGLILEASY